MMQKAPAHAGFTAVELLITLFVAALFLFAGYQLYNVILSSGTAARNQTLAASVANKYIEQYADMLETPCSSGTLLSNSATTVEGLSDVTVSVTVACPVAEAPNLSQLSAIVTYGVGTESTSLTRVVYRGTSS